MWTFLTYMAERPLSKVVFFQRWPNNMTDTVHTNPYQIQGNNSTLCGLLFLRERLMGYSYQDFLNKFDVTSLNAKNDYVSDLMFNAYNHFDSSKHEANQMCKHLIHCFE